MLARYGWRWFGAYTGFMGSLLGGLLLCGTPTATVFEIMAGAALVWTLAGIAFPFVLLLLGRFPTQET